MRRASPLSARGLRVLLRRWMGLVFALVGGRLWCALALGDTLCGCSSEDRRAMRATERLVVVGASEGGLQALTRILSGLPADFPCAIVAAIHTHESSPRYSAAILADQAQLPVVYAEHGAALEPGRVYVAPPGAHTVVTGEGRLELDQGPKVHFTRPAADPLFGSAAKAFGAAVIGVVLTGGGSDGTAGLTAIHKRGGICVVQSPGEADAVQMPMNAIQYDNPDYIAFLDEIGPLLTRLAREPFSGTHAPRRF
ncbi:MAG: chemotaxis protein CheB [Comamonadaceae bacterium]|nr:MAG: chemotaxis protein CheB [Comamonadaceae bacterium]